MRKSKCLIVGGSGQFGITLTKILIKLKCHITISTRFRIKTKNKFNQLKIKNVNIIKLDILNKKEVNNLIANKFDYIFFFAGQSSPSLSFKHKKVTLKSNYEGCKNFIDAIKNQKKKTKFINASSSEIFSISNDKIDINSEKKPISPYGKSKLLSFNYTKNIRSKYNLNLYNAIMFNSESFFRNKNYLIPKICLAAINAKRFKQKTQFGNLDIVREWNWCEDQCNLMLKFLKKKPCDFILSNGKFFSGHEMAKFAFEYFNLDYLDYIIKSKRFYRKKDFNIRTSNFKKNVESKKLNWQPLMYGKKIIIKLIKFYLLKTKI